MNVDQFKAEYENLSYQRKVEGLNNLWSNIVSDIVDSEDLILDILDLAEMAEANDYFGTEGLNI